MMIKLKSLLCLTCWSSCRDAGAHLRLGLFMLDLNSRHWLRQSCSTTSCCTLGVAVAVKAISGTAGYLHG